MKLDKSETEDVNSVTKYFSQINTLFTKDTNKKKKKKKKTYHMIHIISVFCSKDSHAYPFFEPKKKSS